ncbi:MAG: DUF4365 domain-containing protein [Roseomonas sp.]|nr:DUF4365 domain-containing protein [Roseomonas sp.]
MKRGNDTTSRLGVAAIDQFFSAYDWLFREQVLHDWGIDAHVEPKKNNRPIGQLFALQIKTGKSWFVSENSDGFKYTISDEHLDYWLRHQLPVFIMLHDPEIKQTFWQKIDRNLVNRTSKGSWYIRVPKENILDKDSLVYFEKSLPRDETAFRRAHLAIDYSLMKKIDSQNNVYLCVTEWNHKTLSMRGAEFRFNDSMKANVDIAIERWTTHRGIHAYMAQMFPWLNYRHIRPLEDSSGSVEVEEHVMEVELNAIGHSFLRLEKFFKAGQPEKEYEIPYEDSGEMDACTFDEWAYQRAIERD